MRLQNGEMLTHTNYLQGDCGHATISLLFIIRRNNMKKHLADWVGDIILVLMLSVSIFIMLVF